MSGGSFLFTKMSGSGNIFLLCDLRQTKNQQAWSQIVASEINRSQLATLLCQQGRGFCAEGLLFLEACSGKEDFQWDFYNADGSEAEMCGNAALCAARFAYRQGGVDDTMSIKTAVGTIRASLLEENCVEVEMPDVDELKCDRYVTIDEQKTHYHLINSGVPHAVVGNDNVILTEEVRLFASRLRNHIDLQPDGANVTFFQPIRAGEIEAVTYERGVENFTQACGTGAVAAAWCHHQRQKGPEKITVNMPGGQLKVDFSQARPLLSGLSVFLGQISPDNEFF